jgi:hypothetical protein
LGYARHLLISFGILKTHYIIQLNKWRVLIPGD